MDREVLNQLENHLCEIAQSYAKTGIQSPDDVATVKHLLSGLLKIKCLEEMENYQSGGFSRRGRSYDGENKSFRRDSMGRYADGHSGHGDMRQKLERLMQEAGNDRERQMLEDMMSRM